MRACAHLQILQYHLLLVARDNEHRSAPSFGRFRRGPTSCSRSISSSSLPSATCKMGTNNPQFWPNSSFMDFNSYDQPTSTNYRPQSSSRLSYPHSDWAETPDQGDQRMTGSTFNPTFQSSTPYIPQPGSYGTSPGNLISAQHQQLSNPFSNPNTTNVNGGLSSGLAADTFQQSKEEYRRGSDTFSPQQHTAFSNPALIQLPPPPALYHPGSQSYRRQGLPFSDVTSDSSGLDPFGVAPMQSRVPSQDGCVCWSCACITV